VPRLKITEIIKGGPADQRGIHLKAASSSSIDGVELTDQGRGVEVVE